MQPLQSLYNQTIEYTALKEFMFKHLDVLALDYIYKKQPVEGIYEAQKVLLNAFNQIEREYGKKEVSKVINQSE